MNRIFLTLLVLLTGFAGQLSPARASVCVADKVEIGFSEMRIVIARDASKVALIPAMAAPADKSVRKVVNFSRFYDAPSICSVFPGIDRARE